MKYLTVASVLLVVTAANVGFRRGLSGSVEAARAPERAQAERIAGPGVELPVPPARKPPVALASGDDLLRRAAAEDPSDLTLARIAAECGHRLFARAQKAPSNRLLREQAIGHYQACLAHEPTCPDAGTLFADVRERIARLQRMASRPAAPPKAPARAAVPESKPAEVARESAEPPAKAVEAPEARMVGPDGVPYRRADRP
jgi:hypothetical protein